MENYTYKRRGAKNVSVLLQRGDFLLMISMLHSDTSVVSSDVFGNGISERLFFSSGEEIRQQQRFLYSTVLL